MQTAKSPLLKVPWIFPVSGDSHVGIDVQGGSQGNQNWYVTM